MPYDIQEDKYFDAMAVEMPHHFEGVYFLRLTLTDKDGRMMSQNDYVQSQGVNNRKQLRTMPEAAVSSTVDIKGTHAKVTLHNNGNTPAVMLRLNLKGSDGEQILPVIYSDNYFHHECAKNNQRMMKRNTLALIAALLLVLAGHAANKYPYKDARLSVEQRVEDLLARMTIEEKAGQLVCLMGWDSYQINGNKVNVSEKFIKEQNDLQNVLGRIPC